jgi:hypothetical protein
MMVDKKNKTPNVIKTQVGISQTHDSALFTDLKGRSVRHRAERIRQLSVLGLRVEAMQAAALANGQIGLTVSAPPTMPNTGMSVAAAPAGQLLSHEASNERKSSLGGVDEEINDLY